VYTDSKSIQILISLLKSYNIDHVVIAPGTRALPFVHSIENDQFFSCFSITDERSAGYFALGLIQELNRPVAVCCTSGTAVCNLLSATNEAKYQRLPLLILTGDRSQYLLDQYQDQMAPTQGLYGSVCKKSFLLPHVRDETDEWRCTLTVNQALSLLEHNYPGPVNINFQVKENEVFNYNTKNLPNIRKIEIINNDTSKDVWLKKATELQKSKKILLVCGQHKIFTKIEKEMIDKFVSKYNCVLICDNLSNFHSNYRILSNNILKFAALDRIKKLVPNIIITFGGHTLTGVSKLMNQASLDVQHWLINEDGEFIDTFKKLTNVFECKEKTFFSNLMNNDLIASKNGEYEKQWQEISEIFSIPELPYSDMYAVQQLLKQIPEKSLLHIANSMSIRYSQFFEIPESVKVSCNRGANGIDGSMSTFIGASAISNKLSFLLIGDLSFFYDMTALWNRHIGNNVRILVNNNFCGMLFNSHVYWNTYEGVNNYTGAGHNTSARGWCESRGFKYLSATNKKEFEESFNEFMSKKSEKPLLLEVLTEKEKNDQVFVELNKKNRQITPERVANFLLRKITG
jgi:2-succinyl-5-enolpyruvyl-6-hydroxy-3-cyclohexene-1-carboxylate synthase